MNDHAAHGARLRALFEQVCDLPIDSARERLRELSDEPALIEEVFGLLDAQTASLGRAVAPLSALIACLPDTELQVGDTLGSWRLAERLASGGMGTVFIAERADALYRQRVAIKLLRGHADAASVARLAAERQILAGLQHPHIARLFDGGTTPAGRPYLVMECVDGEPLERWLAAHPLALDARLALFERICGAVAHAHQQLVLHCDLKPSNILVRADGSPVLLDFGIARMVDAADDGRAYCTPAYASPELLRGERVGVTSDVFSLGVLLAELLSGQRSTRGVGDGGAAVVPPSRQANAALRWRAKLRGDLDAIVARAAALEPGRRYGSVAALVEDLQRHARHYPVRARKPSLRYRASRFLRRRWRECAVAALALAMSGGFVWRLALERERALEAAHTAEQVSEFLVNAFSAADPRRNPDSQDVSAREVLDAGAARIAADLAGTPAVQARLRLVLGQAYRNLGHPKQSEALLRQAAGGFLAAGVARPVDAADAYSQLAVVLGNDRRGDEAVAAAKRAIALRAQAGDERIESRADSLNTLGLALGVAGDDAGAEAALKQALALRRGLGAEGEKPVATTLNNLGRLYRNAERLADAERAYTESMAITRRLGAPARPSYQISLDGLARTRALDGRIDAALPLLRGSLALARTLYGDASASVGMAHNELANVLHDAGRYAEAEGHYRQSAAIEAKAIGSDSPSYAISINNLASLLEDRGDVARAEALYRQSLAIRRARLPAGDRMIRRSEYNLARLLMRRGALDEAAALMAPLVAERREKLPADDGDRIKGELLDAERLVRSGALDAAQRVLDALALGDEARTKHAGVQAAQLRADLAEARGDAATAISERARAIAVLEAMDSDQTLAIARIEVALARAQALAGRTREAQARRAAAERVLRAALVPGAALLAEIDRERSASGATSAATAAR